jgi:hypothetical protein
VEAAGERFIASQDGQEIEISLPRAEGSSARVWQGNLAPLRGWRSRAFDVRVAAPVIVWQARLSGPVRLCSEIAIS